MSTQIANVNLAGAVVGQSGTVSWAQLLPPATIAQQMRPTQASGSNISLFNESPCLLMVTLPVTGQTFTLPAGRWVAVALPPLEISLTWTVTATAGSGLFNALLVDFFAPGETPHPIGTLGNSPISGSITTPSSPANSFEQDLFTPWVLTGLVGSKDLSISNQLDVTSGIAFLRQADSSVGRVATSASNFLTSTPSATYFLDLNPDGSFSFATSHSGVSNHLTICSLTTDGSGNILAVTDARTLNSTMLSAMSGALRVPPLLVARGGAGVMGTLVAGDVLDVDSTGNLFIKVPAGKGISLQSPNGSTQTQFGGAALGIQFLAGQAAVGNFGVPPIVADTGEINVVNTSLTTIYNSAPPVTGVYRVNAYLVKHNGTTSTVLFRVAFVDPHGQSGTGTTFFTNSGGAGTVVNPLQGAGTASLGDGAYGLESRVIYASSTGAIQVLYQDNGGTPNDFVRVIIERLA